MYSYLQEGEVDPAVGDLDLQSKLNKQGKAAKQKLDKVFEEFVERQDKGATVEDSSDDVNSDENSDEEDGVEEECEVDDESENEGYDSEEVEEYEKNLAAYDEMVGAGSSADNNDVVSDEDKELGSEESEDEVEMIELDGGEHEEEDDNDVQ